MLLATALPLLTAPGGAPRALRWAGAAACLVGLAASRSPTGVGLAALALVLSRPSRLGRAALLATPLLAVALAGVVLSRPDLGRVEPLRLRLDNWRAAAWLWRSAPLAGTGVGSFGQEVQTVPLALGNRPAHAHGLPAEWAAELGAPGLAAVLLLLAAVARLALRVRRERPEIAAALLVVPLHNLVDFSAYVSGVLLPWAVVLGWAVHVSESACDRTEVTASAAPDRAAGLWRRAAVTAAAATVVGVVMLHATSREIEAAARQEPAVRRYELATTAARLAPWRPEPVFELAAAALELGGPEAVARARERLERVRPLRPRSAVMLRLRTALALAAGDVESALAAARLAAELRPASPELEKRYRDLAERLGGGGEADDSP